MRQALRYAAQALLYAPLMALVGYFSDAPRLRLLEPGEALLRLSFTHATQLRFACRSRTAEELAKLPPNMRAAQECPRERSPLAVELELDGSLLYRGEAQPAGLRRDGAAAVYRRIPVAAGEHRLALRLRDRAEGPFAYVRDERVSLAPGEQLVVDFDAARGGFVLRR
jgi:hypothetical protein